MLGGRESCEDDVPPGSGIVIKCGDEEATHGGGGGEILIVPVSFMSEQKRREV